MIYLTKKFSEVSVSELKKIYKKKHKRIVLNYNWSKNIDSINYYEQHPYLSKESARFLIKMGCKLLAMDTPMPDNPKDGYGCEIDSPIHKILLGNNCLLVEYLNNTNLIRKKNKVELVVAPLKIENADGAPARVFAISK